MIIYLHKILPLFFLPVALLLALLVWAAISKKRLPIFLCMAMLLAGSLPVVSDGLFQYIENDAVRLEPQSVPEVDAVVVLSGMLLPVKSSNGVATEWADPDRFFAGTELIKAGKSKTLIFTGAKLPWLPEAPPEGEVLKKYAIDFGIPATSILVTGNVGNTEDEAIAVKELAVRNKYEKAILVTSAFHMPRAAETFRRQGINVIPYPVDFKVGVANTTPMDFLPNADALSNTELAMRELMGRAYYYLKYQLMP
jgi:uncharacterized SAM-binding protein YcdF (DUF218 family)